LKLPPRKKVILVFSLVLAGLLAWDRLVYVPPLLGGGPFNPVGILRNVLGFCWWYSLGAWSARGWEKKPLPARAARAAWYRPGLCRELTGIAPGDLDSLAGNYFSLGLDRQASLLLRASSSPPGLRAALLAQLGDWEGVLLVCGISGDPWARYWRGRALEARGSSAEADSEFAFLPGMPDALARRGRAREELGAPGAAELYREALGLDPANRTALEGISRLGDAAEREAALTKLKSFSPARESGVPVGGKFLFLGTGEFPPAAATRQQSSLDLYLLGWWGEGARILPLAVLSGPGDPYPWRQGGEEFPVPAPGSLAKVRMSWEWPLQVNPGEVELGLSFLEMPAKFPLPAREFPEAIPAAGAVLSPRWVGPESRPVRAAGFTAAQTWLGPCGRLRLELEPVEAGVLLTVTGFRPRGSVRPGQPVGEIVLETAAGGRRAFPLRYGLETGDFRPGREEIAAAAAYPAPDGAVLFRSEIPLPVPGPFTALEAVNLSGDGGLRLDGFGFIPKAPPEALNP
jgi:hypothetical protein